ncbi:MAG: TRAP transporter large permease subunit [Hyphomicrobiaceae bacterium TMED74]|nr:C4-dicarboxylate ABC transporter permease [Filomicrobium sp.]RPG38696.1 MAG: TRAP transporter large permease subunit [Hyphomicrobiaceae bacterium TMED74]
MNVDLAAWMFPVLLMLIFIGVPVAFSLMAVAFVFGLLQFGDAAVVMFAHRVEEVSGSHILAALPLFVFMGAMLQRSGIAEGLFETIHSWTHRLPGGVAVGAIVLCILFAMSSGVVGATETVVGMLAVPAMLKHGYDKGLISGTICAGGSLGSIIPPSVLVVILATIADLGIGELFAAMLLPGLILAGFYILYIMAYCMLRPGAVQSTETVVDDRPLGERLVQTAWVLLPPVVLIVAVLGSIIFAIAVPTEAAAVGAIGSVLMAYGYGRLSYLVVKEAIMTTLSITAMVLTIVVGGLMFAGVFAAAGGLTALQQLLEQSQLGAWGTLTVILLVTFIAGFVLDLISIMLILVPLSLPIIKAYGFDPLWFSIALLIMMQTSMLTPPMAGAIFYFRAIAPPEITLRDMYRGVVPFIALHFVVLGLLIAFPSLALWLPKVLLGGN